MVALGLGLATTLAAAAAPLTLADMPVPRAGQWEKTSDEDGTPKTSRHCESGKPIRTLDLGKDCRTPKVSRTKRGGWAVSTTCVSPHVTSRVLITAAGDFKTAFTSDIDMVMVPKTGKRETAHMHAAYRYIGPCL